MSLFTSGRKHAIEWRRSMLLRSKVATGSDSSFAPCVMYVTGNSGAEGAKACTAVPRVIHDRASTSRWGCDVALRFVNLLLRWPRGWFSRYKKEPRVRMREPTRDKFVIESRAAPLIQQERVRRELITFYWPRA